MNNRASFIDFCQGLLNLNPVERWTPQQARQHPFITGEKFTKPWSVSWFELSTCRSPLTHCTHSHTHKSLFLNPPLSTRLHLQTPNDHTVDWYPHNRRELGRSRMLLPTINIWLNTKLTRLKRRLKRTLSSTGTPILPNRRATDRLLSRTTKIKQAQGTASSFLVGLRLGQRF